MLLVGQISDTEEAETVSVADIYILFVHLPFL